MLQKNTLHPLFWCYFQDIFSLQLWYYHHVSAAPHVSKGNQKRHLSKQSPPKAHARFQKTVWSTEDWLSCVVFSNIISLEQAEKQLHHWFKPRKVLLNHTLCAFGGEGVRVNHRWDETSSYTTPNKLGLFGASLTSHFFMSNAAISMETQSAISK